MERVAAAELVARRLKGAFGSTYLTLMSVIQGIALSVLASRVSDTIGHFDIVDWLFTIDTFLVFVVVWNEYLVAALAFAWIPSFLDSLLPFSLLAAELFMAHAVYHDARAWLFAMSAASFLAMGGLIYTEIRVRTSDADNQDLFETLAGHQNLNIASAGVGSVLFLLAGLIYDVAGFESARLVVATVATVVVALYLSRGVAAWMRIQAYTRGVSTAS